MGLLDFLLEEVRLLTDIHSADAEGKRFMLDLAEASRFQHLDKSFRSRKTEDRRTKIFVRSSVS